MLSEYCFKLIFLALFVIAFITIMIEIKSVGVKCNAYTFSVPIIEDISDDFDLLDEIEPFKGN